MKKVYQDKVRLSFGHSLILPAFAKKVDMDDFISKVNSDNSSNGELMEKFGLFDLASPNFHTYYPEVSAEDINPKDSDYVRPIFRALSEVIVHKKYNPIDFSENSVLKDSMKKLVGQSIYANHEAMVGNELGVIENVSWQKSYTTNDGIVVPAGINAVHKIDAKSHPNIARAVMSDPPSVHSTSVTVSFAWEKSHPKMDDNEFINKLGTFGPDSKLVRRIVSNINAYHEISFVAHGADPFAQRVKDNKINNPNYANDMYSFSEGKVPNSKNYFFSYKDIEEVSLSQQTTTLHNNNNNNTHSKMKEYLLSLVALMALTASADATEEQLQQLILDNCKTLQDSKTSITGLKAQVENLTDTNKALTEELSALKSPTGNASLGAKYLESVINNVTKAYTSLKGDKKSDELIKSFKQLPLETLLALEKEYTDALNETLPLVCKDCNSTNVSRQSAATGTVENENPLPGKKSKDEAAKFILDKKAPKLFGETAAN